MFDFLECHTLSASGLYVFHWKLATYGSDSLNCGFFFSLPLSAVEKCENRRN